MGAELLRYGCPECRAVFRSGFARCPLDGTPLQKLLDDPLCGSTFADRYVIEECVGEGGMGRVYRARHQRVSRRFAIKVLFGELASEPKMQDRFAREAEAASRLSHPNVISVVDFGETEQGLLYLVMDWVEGPELSDVIYREAPLSRERIVALLRGLAAGLAHAHDRGLVHRDFKSENVIVASEGDREVPKIVDFGIAVINEGIEKARLTTEGMVMGTPAYMSPEQATGEPMDQRTDLFALGVLTYEMLAGVLPFEGAPIEIARKNLAATPPPIAERVPGLAVDPGLEALAFKLMSKRPDERYQTGHEVLDALETVEGPGEKRAPSTPPGAEAAPVAATPAPPVWELAEDLPGTAAVTSGRRPGRPAWLTAGIATIAAVAVVAVALLGRGGDVVVEGKEEVAEAEGPRAGEREQIVAAAEEAVEEVAELEEVAEHGELEKLEDALVGDAGEDEGVAAGVAEEAPVPAVRPPRDRKEVTKQGAVARAAEPKPAAPGPAKPEPAGPKPSGPADEPVTLASLEKLYVSVGQAVHRLEQQRGKEVARPYVESYHRIPYVSALRTESLRKEVHQRLVALRRQVMRELR